VPRPLATLRGDLETLLQDPALAAHEGFWLQVTLTDTVRPMQAMERLRRRFPHTLLLGFASTAPVIGGLPSQRGPARRDRDLVADFITELRGAPATGDELALLGRAVDACCEDSDVDMLLGEPAVEASVAIEEWAEVLF
jgi:exonuclease SbcD